jgi:uncharacterized membrane protein
MTNGHDEQPAAAGGAFGKNRIEALADGIFAVAMTLLVLDVKLEAGLKFTTEGALLDRLLSLEHSFVIYFISFILLGMFWVGHHAHFHYIRYVDHTILWINLFFLFCITAVPFATDLLGDFNRLRLPYALYGAQVIALAGLLVLQILYLRRHPELAQPDLTAGVARRIIARTALFAAIPLLSIILAFHDSRWALYSLFLLVVVHFLPGRIDIYARAAGPRDRSRHSAPP